jgi:hypothetical protein
VTSDTAHRELSASPLKPKLLRSCSQTAQRIDQHRVLCAQRVLVKKIEMQQIETLRKQASLSCEGSWYSCESS